MQGGRSNKFIIDIYNTCKASNGISDLFSRISDKLKESFSIDKIVVKNISQKKENMSAGEEYAINTKQLYIDNRLSGYSAFPDLINYYNSGFRSSAIIPVINEKKAIGTITLLSQKEEAFGKEEMAELNIASNILNNECGVQLEREKGREMEKFFDAAFGIMVPQAIVSQKGRLILANAAMMDLLGKPKEMPTSSLSQFFKIDFTKISGSSWEEEYVESTSESGRRFRLSAKALGDGLLHLSFNETTALNLLEERAKALDYSATEAFITMDNDLRINWASANISRILKVDKDYLIGRKLSDFAGSIPTQSLSKGSMLSEDMQLNFDNNIKSEVTATILKGKNGFSSILSINFDKYLASVKKALRDVVQISSDAVIEVDASGSITKINKSAEKLLKYRSDELEGMQISSLYADTDSQNRFSSSLSIAKKNDVVTDIYVNMLPKSIGEKMPFQQSIMSIKNNNNAVDGYFVVSRELSTKMEKERLNETLDRTTKQMKEIKSESDLKTQFIYNVSHDFKTPITNIKGFSTLLYKEEFGVLTDEQKEYVKIIMDELDRLMLLIEQILDVAKLSSGRIKLDLQQVEMKDLMENASIKALAESAANKGIILKHNVDYNVPQISADPNRLIQAFVNLIGNAIKFTDAGGLISVSIFKKGKNIRVEVTDTGMGIDKEERAKLFKKFYQLPRKGLTTHEGAGTGLGLSITKEIVNLHGGQIGVKSEVGKGSTFWFTIPTSQKVKKKVD